MKRIGAKIVMMPRITMYKIATMGENIANWISRIATEEISGKIE